MEHNKTPIEQWIEESNPYDSQVPLKAFNYGCNKLLTYLGLDIPDPKKWVEEMKNHDMQLAEAWEQGSIDARNKQMFQYSNGLDKDNPYRDKMNWEHHENVKFRQKFQIDQLQAENERLKEGLMKIYALDINYVNDMQAIFQFREIADNALKGGKNEL
jgi:hypothetical protein